MQEDKEVKGKSSMLSLRSKSAFKGHESALIQEVSEIIMLNHHCILLPFSVTGHVSRKELDHCKHQEYNCSAWESAPWIRRR